MFSMNKTERGLIGFAIEIQRDALSTTARAMAVAFCRHVPLALVVAQYGRPESTGDMVAIHNSLELKAAQMLGERREPLAEDVSLFELAGVT